MRISDWSSDVCSSDLLLRADRGQAGNQHQFVGGRQLHHLARRQQRAGGLLTGHHDMAEPWREAVPGIVTLRTQFGRGAARVADSLGRALVRSEEHTSELQSLMRISYAVFCL